MRTFSDHSVVLVPRVTFSPRTTRHALVSYSEGLRDISCVTFMLSNQVRKEKQTLSLVRVLERGHYFLRGEGGSGQFPLKEFLHSKNCRKNRASGAMGEKSSKCYHDVDF